MERVAETAHRGGSQHGMPEVCRIEHIAQGGLDAGHVLGSEIGHLVAHALGGIQFLTDEVGQVAGIDLHRT